jgi:type III secretion protein C
MKVRTAVHQFCNVSAAIWLLILSPYAMAAAIPFDDRTVTLTAREEPIASFLQGLFGQMDIPVVVSSGVKGAVNGNFSGRAAEVFSRISRSFGLVSYYDGTVVHVYAASELTTRTLNVPASQTARVVRDVQELRLTDQRNSLRSTRDGALIAVGTRRFVEQVEELARGQQASAAAAMPLGFKTFYLRYAWAQDVSAVYGGRQVTIPGVASILRSLMTTGQRNPAYLAAQDQLLRPSQPRLRGQGLARVGNQGTLGLSDTDQRAAVDPVAAAYGANPQGALPAAAPGGSGVAIGDPQRVRIEADPRLNAVIVRDAPERLAQYEQLVASLDIEPQALEIEATIIDINTDKLRELGVNWRWSNARNSILFGNGTDSDLSLRPNTDITPQGAGGFVNLVLGSKSQFVARINALQEQGAARVVSNPQVMTLSNVEAVFDNTKTFYVKVAGRDEVDLFNVSAGTTLRVTPHVFKDKEQVRIKLLVAIEDGSISGAQVQEIPIVERSSINTQALIFEGESLLIGGMVREAKSNKVSKVPLLGDIPVLGNLFKNTTELLNRTERLFLISPRLPAARVAQNSESQPAPGGSTSAAAEAAKEAARATQEERRQRRFVDPFGPQERTQ